MKNEIEIPKIKKESEKLKKRLGKNTRTQ
jgi:hypothetical protein